MRSDCQDMTDLIRHENPDGGSSVVLVCEHASSCIPPEYEHLGLSEDQRQSHVVWDPGAMPVAMRLSETLDAALIAATVSRLIYDCNRPPNSSDAMPARSEVIDIPGNAGLSQADRDRRTSTYYEPFRSALAERIAQTENPVIVTVHSFTPVYHGRARDVEIGVLHDSDSRLADAMLEIAGRHSKADVRRNQPYGPEHGVTHTLREHALPGGHPNVMLEIRNDLIRTEAEQHEMADMLARWIADAFVRIDVPGDVKCSA